MCKFWYWSYLISFNKSNSCLTLLFKVETQLPVKINFKLSSEELYIHISLRKIVVLTGYNSTNHLQRIINSQSFGKLLSYSVSLQSENLIFSLVTFENDMRIVGAKKRGGFHGKINLWQHKVEEMNARAPCQDRGRNSQLKVLQPCRRRNQCWCGYKINYALVLWWTLNEGVLNYVKAENFLFREKF